MKKSKWILFHSWIYRRTGYYSIFAEQAEYAYIQSEWDKIEIYYNANREEMYLDSVVGLWIGTWQAAYGFVRPWKSFK